MQGVNTESFDHSDGYLIARSGANRINYQYQSQFLALVYDILFRNLYAKLIQYAELDLYTMEPKFHTDRL